MNNTIKYLIMDVDGTLTDGKIYMGNDGEVMKAFDIKDGYGIHDLLIPYGVLPVIITGRISKIVENRCKELGIIYLFQGVKDKVKVLTDFVNKEEASFSEVAYIGDDLNDLECMNIVFNGGGIVGCPANAVKKVKTLSTFISIYDGGNGAVRDFIEYLISLSIGRQSNRKHK